MEALRNGVFYALMVMIGVMILASVLAAVVRAVSLLFRRARHFVASHHAGNPVAGGPTL